MRKPNLAAAAFVLLLAAGSCCALRGVAALNFYPQFLQVNGGPAELQIPQVVQCAEAVVAWNGEVRQSTCDVSGFVTVKIPASDLLKPALVEITMMNPYTGDLLASGYLPVVYGVSVCDAVYDRVRKRFFLTTPANVSDKRFPVGSVVALDPDTGVIGPAVAIGDGPTSMALSEDGSALYVAVEGEGVVRRLNPDTLTVVSEFRFRSGGQRVDAPYSRCTIAVDPTKAGRVAIRFHDLVNEARSFLAAFDGTARLGWLVSPTGRYDRLLFSPDGKYLFAGSYNRVSGSPELVRFSISDFGIAPETMLTVAEGAPVAIRDNILFTSKGTLVNIQTMEAVNTLGVEGGLSVDADNGRILVAGHASGTRVYWESLHAFDLATQRVFGILPLGTVDYATANGRSVRQLIRFGTDGVLYTSSYGLMVFHTPLAGPVPVTEARAVVNAASQQGGVVAPGEILSIYGANLGPETPKSGTPNESGRFPASLEHVEVWFGRVAGTVLMAHKGQINVVAPFELSAGSTIDLQVWRYGIPSAKIPVTVVSATPALFTRDSSGRGLVAVVNQDGTVNEPSLAGSVVALWGTGGGAVPGAASGGLASKARSFDGTVRAFIGGRETSVLYAGTAPGMITGAFQINVRIPADAPPGIASLSINVNGQESPKGVTLEIR